MSAACNLTTFEEQGLRVSLLTSRAKPYATGNASPDVSPDTWGEAAEDPEPTWLMKAA